MKVVTFGELMVRLQPFNYERFVQANNLEFILHHTASYVGRREPT